MYKSMCSSRSIEPSYLSNVGLFQLGGNLVASISSMKGNWWFAESSTCRDVVSWSSQRETSTWHSRRGSSLLRPGYGCWSGQELSTSAWTFLLCCTFLILLSLCHSLSFSSRRASWTPAWRNRSSSLYNLSSSHSFRIISSSLRISTRTAKEFPSWLTSWLSCLFLVVTIAARSISAPRWALKCYRKGLVGSSNNNVFCGCYLIASVVASFLMFQTLQIPPSREGGPAGTPTLKLELDGECRWFKWEFWNTLFEVTEPIFIGIILGLNSFGPILLCYDFITENSYITFGCDLFLPLLYSGWGVAMSAL